MYVYILAFNYDQGWICAQKRVEICHWLNLHKISWKPNTSNCSAIWSNFENADRPALFNSIATTSKSTKTHPTLSKTAHVESSTIFCLSRLKGRISLLYSVHTTLQCSL